MADLKSILDPLQVPNNIKGDAWDAFQAAGNADDFKARFDKIDLPKEAKAALWDAKFSGGQAQPATDPNQGKYAHPGYKSTLPWPLNKFEEAVSDSTNAMAEGAQKLFGGGRTTDERLGGASEMGRGFLNTAGVPFLLEAGGAAPLRTAKALGTAALVHPVATKTAEVLGAGPGTQDFAGDVSSLVAGGLAARKPGTPPSGNGTPPSGPGVLRKVVNAATNPATADTVGLFDPRVSHGLRIAGRVVKAIDAFMGKDPAAATPEATAPAAPAVEAPAPAPKPAQPPMPRDARRATAAVPETGVPESVERARLAREQISQDLTKTAYKDLSAVDRAAVDDLVSRGYMGNEGAAPVSLGPPKPASKPASGPSREAKPAAKPAAASPVAVAPPAAVPEAAPAVEAPAPAEASNAIEFPPTWSPRAQELGRQLHQELNPDGAPAPAVEAPAPAPDYAAAARGDKAGKLAEALHAGGISLDDAKLMDSSHWKMLADGIGVNVPSAASITETLGQLKKFAVADTLAELNKMEAAPKLNPLQAAAAKEKAAAAARTRRLSIQ